MTSSVRAAALILGAALVLAGCARPGQLGQALPGAPAPAAAAAPAAPPPDPALAEPEPDPTVAAPAEPVSGTVDSRVTIRTPGPAVYSVRTVVLEPGEVLEWRKHPGTEMAVVHSGTVTLRRQGACDPAGYTTGQAFFVGDAVPYRLSNQGAVPTELVVSMLLAPGAPETVDTADACARR